jgi:hypothetical protein
MSATQYNQPYQDRTDMVEYIDSYFLHKFNNITVKEGAKINS